MSDTTERTATAFADANIAFIKYRGSCGHDLRIPSNGSISMNLAGLETRTQVKFDPALESDSLTLNGKTITGPGLERVSALLERVRCLAYVHSFAEVVSKNNLPTGVGIASSASAYAALALGASAAAGDTVTLSASVGSVTNNGDGTWSWSYPTTGGPAQSQTVTITADDSKGGIKTTTIDPTVNNVAPTVTSVTGPSSPQAIGTSVSMSGAFTDPGTLDTQTATWDWGDGSATTSGTVNESNGSGMVSGNHTYTAAGVYIVNLTVTDKDGGVGSNTFQYIVVYDSSTGFVTGGWINSSAGAYMADPSLTVKATFGFVSKYQKGATVPSDNTEFQFQAGGFNFHSDTYDWLVVNQNGANAQFNSSGSVNGALGPNGTAYKFMLWAGDGSLDTTRNLDN